MKYIIFIISVMLLLIPTVLGQTVSDGGFVELYNQDFNSESTDNFVANWTAGAPSIFIIAEDVSASNKSGNHSGDGTVTFDTVIESTWNADVLESGLRTEFGIRFNNSCVGQCIIRIAGITGTSFEFGLFSDGTTLRYRDGNNCGTQFNNTGIEVDFNKYYDVVVEQNVTGTYAKIDDIFIANATTFNSCDPTAALSLRSSQVNTTTYLNYIRFFNMSELVQTLPSIPIITAPENETVSGLNQTITWTGDGDTYTVFHDNVDASIPVCSSIVGLSCQVNATSGETTYFYRVQAENILGGVNSSVNQWTFDSTVVDITILDPTQSEAFNKITSSSIEVNVTYFNINLNNTITNITDPTGALVFNDIQTDLGVGTFMVSTIIDLSTNLSGTYTLSAFGIDEAGNTDSDSITFIVDVDDPVISNLVNNASNTTETGFQLEFNVNFTDVIELGDYIFSWNDTGLFVNDSVQNLPGQFQLITTTKTVTASVGTEVCGQYFVTDNAGNEIVSSPSCFTVAITIVPPQPSTAGFGFLSIVPIVVMAWLFVMFIRSTRSLKKP